MNAITLYRVGRAARRAHLPFVPRLCEALTFLLFNSVIPLRAEIGAGTRCGHRGVGVVINPDARIGEDVLIRPHVVIGGGGAGREGAPTIGNNVRIGVGAKILGKIEIGDDVEIGANAVVVKDVPARSVAIGVPARTVPIVGGPQRWRKSRRIDEQSGLIRYEELPAEGEERLRVLYATNMWPDERRPYYGSFIASQARSLPSVGVSADVVYVLGHAGPQAYLKAMAALPAASRRCPYDLVHIHYGHTLAAGLGVRRRPLVVSFCGEDLLGAPRGDGFTRKSQIEVAAFRRLARTATLTITKSQEMEDALPADVRPRNRILPNGVDLEQFAPRPRAPARAELGWDPDEQVILFLGNPEDPRKNVGLAEAAAAVVGRDNPRARLHIAWKVKIDHVPVLMNAADCLVFPSVSEGSPNAIKEAMACELPIVASPVGDIAERLSGIDNCYIRDRTPEQFAEALRLALASGRAPAARPALESLGTRAIAERLVAIYEEAIELQGEAGHQQQLRRAA